MKQRGSQFCETLEESEYIIAGRVEDSAILQDLTDGHYDLYVENDDYAGHVIVIDGIGYEFVRTANAEDLQAAGVETVV
jgi:hypothetical protein